jgi:hypothetical protein
MRPPARTARLRLAGAQALGLKSWTDGPQVESPDSSRPRRRVGPSNDGKEEKRHINNPPRPHPFRCHVHLWAIVGTS